MRSVKAERKPRASKVKRPGRRGPASARAVPDRQAFGKRTKFRNDPFSRFFREAKRRLTGSSSSIGAIALDLGFEDAAYFSRLFHAKSGMSPQQYRLSFRQNASS